MPKITPLLADQGVVTGPGGPNARAVSFDSSIGLSAVAEATDRLSSTFARLGAMQLAEEKRQKSRSDRVWAGEQYELARRSWNEWLMAPENVNDPEVAGRFLKQAKEGVDATIGGAPSPEAAEIFKAQVDGAVTSAYGESLNLGRRAGLARVATSLDTRAQSAVKNFRAGGAPDELFADRAQLFSEIDDMLGTLSPDAANKMKEAKELDFIYAAIDADPATAAKLIDQSDNISEQQRHSLRRVLESKQTAKDYAAQYAFGTRRDDARAQWEAGKNFEPIPLNEYVAAYGAEMGGVRKQEDDSVLRIMRGVFQDYNDIRDKHPAYQAQHIEKLSKAIGGAEDALKLKHLSDKVSANVRTYNADKVGWLVENNDEIRQLADQINAVTPEERIPLMMERNRALLKYQGPAPADASPTEAAKYLNLPENQRALLTVAEAEQYAAKFNQGSPGEMRSQLDSLAMTFPDEQQRIIAFNDMVRLPPGERGVRQDLQLAIQNQGAWWIDNYLAAISNSQNLAKLTDVEQSRLESLLYGNGTWLAFQRSLIGDNLQRTDEILGFKYGIMNYARSMIFGGESEKAAITKATDRLIGESLGFTAVNDRALVVPRQRGNLPPRTDDEIEDIGRRLSVALQFVNPAKIDLAPLGLDVDLPNEAKLQMVRDQISKTGFFQPIANGQGVTLYLEDEDGGLVQARDRKGRPFMIMFDDLPSFMRTDYAPTVAPGGPMMPMTATRVPMTPGLDELVEKTGSDLLGTTQYRTHWPAQPPWIRNE